MGAPTILLIPVIRAGLFFGCRLTILPRLFGEAKHASLDLPNDDEGDAAGLPAPVQSAGASPSSSSTTAHPPRLLSLSPSSLSALTLALSFEESTLLFVLVLMEAMGFDAVSLRANWKASLFGVVALAICFIPMGLCVLVTYTLLPPIPLDAAAAASGRRAAAMAFIKRTSFALVPFLAWLVVFLKVPLPAAAARAAVHSTLLQAGLARTAVVGVTLIALLSGSGAMGAVMDSYQTLFAPRTRSAREPSASDLRSAQASFQKACQDLDRTKRDVERLQQQQDDPAANANASSWFGSIDRAFRGTAKSREIKALQLEISSLSMLASAMRDELDTLKERKREAQWRTTVGGRIWIVVGHAFALYCVMRVGVVSSRWPQTRSQR